MWNSESLQRFDASIWTELIRLNTHMRLKKREELDALDELNRAIAPLLQGVLKLEEPQEGRGQTRYERTSSSVQDAANRYRWLFKTYVNIPSCPFLGSAWS